MNRSEAESKFGAVNVQNVLAASAPMFERGHEIAKHWLNALILPNIYLGCGLGILNSVRRLVFDPSCSVYRETSYGQFQSVAA